MAFILFLALSFLIRGAFGELMCEDLPVEMCSFAISSSGNRCLLETSAESKRRSLHCKTSEATAATLMMNEYIETDSCIRACGVDRMTVGISSDNLFDSRFTKSLCSSPCINNCPNILHLYSRLALGEGLHLPDLCSRMQAISRRALVQNLAAMPPSQVEALFDADSQVSVESLLAGTPTDSPVPVDASFAEVPADSPVSTDDLISEAPAAL